MTNSDLQVAIAELRADIIEWLAGFGLAQASQAVGIPAVLP